MVVLKTQWLLLLTEKLTNRNVLVDVIHVCANCASEPPPLRRVSTKQDCARKVKNIGDKSRNNLATKTVLNFSGPGVLGSYKPNRRSVCKNLD